MAALRVLKYLETADHMRLNFLGGRSTLRDSLEPKVKLRIYSDFD